MRSFAVDSLKVSPMVGLTSGVYTYSVRYRSMQNKPPILSGALYQATTTLPAGNHTFFFAIANSSTRIVYPSEPTILSGPNVGTISAPAAPTEEFVVPANPLTPGSLITDVMD